MQVRGNFQGPGRLREPILQAKIFPEFMNFPAWRVVWKACGLAASATVGRS